MAGRPPPPAPPRKGEGSAPSRPGSPGRVCLFALFASVAPLLAGCVETGDFGRVKRNSAWNDILETTGSVAAGTRQEPVSAYRLTDDEREFRDRAYRFLVPALGRSWFDRALADLAATRVLPPEPVADHRAYAQALATGDSASPASRYRRLSEDAAADLRLLPPLGIVAGRVFTADGVRLRTLDHARDVRGGDGADAEARVAENRCLLAWVAVSLDGRVDGYRHALEHLVIETPQADAVPAERALAALADARATFRGMRPPSLAGCAPRGPGGPADAPLVLKG